MKTQAVHIVVLTGFLIIANYSYAAKATGEPISPVFDTVPAVADEVLGQELICYVEARAFIEKKVWRKYLVSALTTGLKDTSFRKVEAGTYAVPVEFTIDTNGSIRDVKCIKNDPDALTTLVFEVIAKGPQWHPAIHRGRLASSSQKQVIVFIIDDEGCELEIPDCSLKRL